MKQLNKEEILSKHGLFFHPATDMLTGHNHKSKLIAAMEEFAATDLPTIDQVIEQAQEFRAAPNHDLYNIYEKQLRALIEWSRKPIIILLCILTMASCTKGKENYICHMPTGQDTIINTSVRNKLLFEIKHQCQCN